MSFATRCPACGTTFKVMPDQLLISEGWVRCGRCSKIFDGNENLQEADSAVTADADADASAVVEIEVLQVDASAAGSSGKSGFDFPDFSAFPSVPPAENVVDKVMRTSEPDEEQQPENVVATAGNAAPVPAPWLGRWPSLELTPGARTIAAETATNAFPRDLPVASAVDSETAPDANFDVARASALAEPAAPPSTTPEQASVSAGESSGFATLDQHEGRLKRWLRRFPGLDRLPLRSIGVGALVLLGTQLVYQTRDAIAARQPSLQPALNATCKVVGCTLSAMRRIDAITIDGASFARDPSGEGYQLTFILRNGATVPLAMPAIELTLLDTQEKAVIRRVLVPAEFNAPDVLPAHAEHSTMLALALSAAPALAPVAGYGIAAFYP